MPSEPSHDTRAQLRRLLLLAGLGLGLTALVSISVMAMLKFKIDALTQHAAPEQLRMTELKSNLDAMLSISLRLREVRNATDLNDVQGEAEDLAKSLRSEIEGDKLSEGLRQPLLSALTSFDSLRRMAAKRLNDLEKAHRTIGDVHRGLDLVRGGVEQAASLTDQLGEQAQSSLISAREANQQANRAIQQALTLREKLARLESIQSSIAVVEKRFKLSPMKEKTGALIDNIEALDLKALKLDDAMSALKTTVGKYMLGESGLFALRTAQLKGKGLAAEDAAYLAAVKELDKALEAAMTALNGRIDPLQLAVSQEAKRMNHAVEQMKQVKIIQDAANQVLLTVQSLLAQAERLVNQGSGSNTPKRREELANSLNTISRSLHAQARGIDSLRDSSSSVRAARRATKNAIHEAGSLREQFLSTSGAVAILGEIEFSRISYDALLKSVTESQRTAQAEASQFLAAASEVQESATSQVHYMTKGTAPLLLVLCVFLAWYGRRRGLIIVQGVLKSEAEGQEILQSQKRMVHSLAERTVALEGEIGSLKALSNSMDENASATLARARESTVGAKDVSNVNMASSKRIEALATTSRQIADEINTASTKVKAAVLSCQSARQQVGALQASSAKVGGILTLITNIAEQIHILSLNASIEAARSGDAGRGFAVLAQQVRALAKRTADSAGNIQNTIESVQGNIQEVFKGIGAIDGLVAEVEQIQHHVASAAIQQQSSTQEVQGSVVQAAEGSGRLVLAFEEVAIAASGTSQAASRTREAAVRLESLAHDLTQLAEA